MAMSMRAVLALSLLFSFSSQAKDLCQEFRNAAPLPTWYSELCGKDGKMKAKIGGAYSTFGDSFNLNPAAILTSKTPIGIEYVRSWSSSSGAGSGRNNFAFVKGFGVAGAAITTNSDETFYGNSVFQGLTSSSTSTIGTALSTYSSTVQTSDDSLIPTLNFGSALDVSKLFEKAQSFLPMGGTIGVMGKYSRIKNQIVPAFGLSWQVWKFTFGYSFTEDPAKGTTPKSKYDTFTLGLKTSFFQLEGVMIINEKTTAYSLSGVNSIKPAYFVTLSSKLGPLLLTAAMRSFKDAFQKSQTQYHLAVDYVITPKIAIEYLDNYIYGTHSLGIQVLF